MFAAAMASDFDTAVAAKVRSTFGKLDVVDYLYAVHDRVRRLAPCLVMSRTEILLREGADYSVRHRIRDTVCTNGLEILDIGGKLPEVRRRHNYWCYAQTSSCRTERYGPQQAERMDPEQTDSTLRIAPILETASRVRTRL